MEKGTSLIFNVRTSQSYSGTLPVNATVANPGGGYTISDSVTAVYSMQVSGDATSGTFTLNVSIQATTGYNESENAAGAVTPWTIEEPGSYQLELPVGRELRGRRRRGGLQRHLHQPGVGQQLSRHR